MTAPIPIQPLRRSVTVATAMLLALSGHVLAGKAPLPPAAVPVRVMVPAVYVHTTSTALRDMYLKNVESFREICPNLFKKVLNVQGDLNKLGRMSTDLYMDSDRSVSYSTGTFLAPAKGDPCSVRLEERTRIRHVRFDGANTSIVDIDSATHKGRRRLVSGRSPLLKLGEEASGAVAFSQGSRRTGQSRIAGQACESLRQDVGGSITEVCQLSDPALPAMVQGVPLKVSRRNASGELVFESEVDQFDARADVDQGVFDLPKDLDLRGERP